MGGVRVGEEGVREEVGEGIRVVGVGEEKGARGGIVEGVRGAEEGVRVGVG